MQNYLIIDFLEIKDRHVDVWHIEKTEKGYENHLYTNGCGTKPHFILTQLLLHTPTDFSNYV